MLRAGLLMILLTTYCSSTIAQKLTFLAGDFCPYTCDPAKEEGRLGFTHDILNEIFPDYDIQVKRLPWERAFKVFNQNKKGVDGIIGITKELSIDNSISTWPENEIGQYTHAFYVLNSSPLTDTWKYEGVDSLKGKHLGAVRGYSYCSSAMTKYVRNETAPNVTSLAGSNLIERNLQKLLLGRIDLWIANIPMADYFIFNNKDKVEGVKRVAKLPCDGVVDAYPVFYNDDKGKNLALTFDKGITAMRDSGKLDKILLRYGLEDWDK